MTKKPAPNSRQTVLASGKMAELMTKKVSTSQAKKEKTNYKSKRV
jgi:hypothetical protein